MASQVHFLVGVLLQRGNCNLYRPMRGGEWVHLLLHPHLLLLLLLLLLHLLLLLLRLHLHLHLLLLWWRRSGYGSMRGAIGLHRRRHWCHRNNGEHRCPSLEWVELVHSVRPIMRLDRPPLLFCTQQTNRPTDQTD